MEDLKVKPKHQVVVNCTSEDCLCQAVVNDMASKIEADKKNALDELEKKVYSLCFH